MEFKSPSNDYTISVGQMKMKIEYEENQYKLIIENDYDEIIREVIDHMQGVRIRCRHCIINLISKESLMVRLMEFHKIIT